MKTARVVVTWPEGLHARPACQLVRVARVFRATVRLKVGSRIADARSLLSLLMLCATLGTAIDIEADGDDEDAAIEAVGQVFVETLRR